MKRLLLALLIVSALAPNVSAQPRPAPVKPDGEMRWALYVTLAPAWFGSGEVTGGSLTPCWVLYALPDALVKPMPGNLMAPSLAESWTVSADQRTYEFKLREGLKFHNGDPFTAEDVKWSFQRSKVGKVLKDRVREVEVVGPSRVRFHLHEPFPDFMAFYGTLATGAGWIVPRKYVEKVGDHYLDFFDQWDPKSPWHDRRVRLAANHAIDRRALTEAETLGASRPTGSMVPRTFDFALSLPPYAYDPATAKRLLAEAGYPNGFDGGDFYPYPPYWSAGETIVGFFGAVGIRMKVRTMERAAFQTAWAGKKLSGVCMCTLANFGNAATRIADVVTSDGTYARGADPDIEALFKQQSRETDRKKREATLHQIQQMLYDRVRFGPLYEFIWVSGIGPRVAEAGLILIDPYPWSAPLEDVRLKGK